MNDLRPPMQAPVNAVDGRVAEELVGEVWPGAHPGEDAALYGHPGLEPRDPVEVRSLQTFRLHYTVGRYGLDDTGAIKVVFRAMGDGDALQASDPAAPNYVTATSSSGVPLKVEYRSRGAAARPRWKALTVVGGGGYLSEGDAITVVFGDTSHGSPGMRMQTMAEAAFEFKVLADVCAVGQFHPIANTPTVAIVPGDAVRWKAVLPSLRRPGERFRLGIKAEDKWGNPTDRAVARLRFEPSRPVDGLPPEFDYQAGRKSAAFDDLRVAEPGVVRIRVLDEGGSGLAESPPLVVRDGPFGGYWGDMHGQSGESIGITTARQYFDFARNKSFLDATGHQANDFQVNNAFWGYLQTLTAQYNEDGVFATLPGYEWSGNTAVGGDRNVYYRTEGRPIYRSSHALLPDRSDLHTDAGNARLLFARLAGEDCVAYAHVGGRYADTAYAHDGELRRVRRMTRAGCDRALRPCVQPRRAGDPARRHRDRRRGHGGGRTRAQGSSVPASGRQSVPRDERGRRARARSERRQSDLGIGVHRGWIPGLEQPNLRIPRKLIAGCREPNGTPPPLSPGLFVNSGKKESIERPPVETTAPGRH